MNQIKCTVAVKTSLFLLGKKEALPGFGGTGGHVHLFQGNKGTKV